MESQIIAALGTPAAFGLMLYLFGRWYFAQQEKRDSAQTAEKAELIAFVKATAPELAKLAEMQHSAIAIMERVDARTEKIVEQTGACDDRVARAQRIKEQRA